ncbi:MAG: hypothetical protein FWE03_06305 [Firmicutes bacterium]|nr:hypothetical protein [Bacillota bacterium]
MTALRSIRKGLPPKGVVPIGVKKRCLIADIVLDLSRVVITYICPL